MPAYRSRNIIHGRTIAGAPALVRGGRSSDDG